MSDLLKKISDKKARVGIVGLGYVGLPLAVEFLKAGFKVVGFDVNQDKINAIENKTLSMDGVDVEDIDGYLKNKSFGLSSDCSSLENLDVVSICVPTPLSKTRDPDLSYIVTSVRTVAENLKPEQLIVLESTTYPGTTEEIVLPIMKEMGWELDKDYYLAFSPERVDPGNKEYNTKNIPKIIGGQSPKSLELSTALYQSIINKIHPVSSAKVAEMTKLLENTFRMVNVALVNEIAMMCNHLGVNVWEVIDAAATKPFGFLPFYPGPGLGGHCLPVDPIYLSWKARMMETEARFIDLAQLINTYMPKHVVEIVIDALNKKQKALLNANVLVLGVTYKKDINDIREAPAIDILKQLHKKGAIIAYNDPFIRNLTIDGEVELDLTSVNLNEETLKEFDAVILVTDHSSYDMEFISERASLMIDTRNATKNLQKNREKIVLL